MLKSFFFSENAIRWIIYYFIYTCIEVIVCLFSRDFNYVRILGQIYIRRKNVPPSFFFFYFCILIQGASSHKNDCSLKWLRRLSSLLRTFWKREVSSYNFGKKTINAWKFDATNTTKTTITWYHKLKSMLALLQYFMSINMKYNELL